LIAVLESVGVTTSSWLPVDVHRCHHPSHIPGNEISGDVSNCPRIHLQYWKVLVSQLPPGFQSTVIDVLTLPIFLVMRIVDHSLPLPVKDLTGYCALFEDILSG
jgi:hypothetical protein